MKLIASMCLIAGVLIIFAVLVGMLIVEHRLERSIGGPEDPRYNHIDLNCYITRHDDTANAVVMDPDCRKILSQYCDWYPGPSTAMDMP